MSKPLVIIGAGGHASVLTEILLTEGRKIIAVVSPEIIMDSSPLAGMNRLMTDEALLATYSPEQVELVNGMGAIPGNDMHFRLFNYFSEKGYHFISVISPDAIVSKCARLADGVQIMAGAIVQTNASVSMNCIVNSGAIIEHDCCIGAHNHIAPNATLSGGVITENQVHVGTGANVIQGIKIDEQAIIGAGCTIVRDVPKKQVIVPARSRILR
ncbi:acetyltransferase [Psychrobacter sp. DAB_AL43B]|uniref:acetyltransferase n=1 Tax=Psychrobacter sp. DAB_AL43B TaxID=1028416 RepID=UPI0009A87BDF|nr:acetyltransferase [Psychrobacter sp. DAB_AL43B]SLJ83934.1 sialic acid biosynthesis protein NeuD [Psychrobacter sp. DAB_AL43B]